MLSRVSASDVNNPRRGPQRDNQHVCGDAVFVWLCCLVVINATNNISAAVTQS